MTDLHTHILPGMDDGSKSVAESLKMLALEREQGVTTVCCTPHFYPEQEGLSSFLRRRTAAYDTLRAALPADAPALCLGAEVAWFPTLAQFDALGSLCLGDSGCFLLELPFQLWSPRLLDGLYQLPEQTGLTPILAHVERYAALQGKARMKELLSLGLPMQMNAASVLAGRRKMLRLLRQGDWYLGSDCHNLTSRPPELGRATAMLSKKLDTTALFWQPG